MSNAHPGLGNPMHRLPEMTPEDRAKFRAELARQDEEIRRFYGKPAKIG
jgi:hypothetical protein